MKYALKNGNEKVLYSGVNPSNPKQVTNGIPLSKFTEQQLQDWVILNPETALKYLEEVEETKEKESKPTTKRKATAKKQG